MTRRAIPFRAVLTGLVLLTVLGLAACYESESTYEIAPVGPPPETAKVPVEESFHGTVLVDDYAWLHDADDPAVVAWTEAQTAYAESVVDDLPQKAWLAERFNALWRYDDESVPRRVLEGDRLFYYTKKKEDEKWVYVTRENENAEPVEMLNPNTWPETETLAGISPSRDGKYVAFGKAHGGDENPIISVMETATGEILPDKLRGWKQSVGSWLPDGSGFYYTCKPLEGEVPEGEHEYWHSVWLHKLGADPAEDVKVFWDDEVKEYWHGVGISEDGKYEVYYRSLFNVNDLWIKPYGADTEPVALATGMKFEYGAEILDDKILITTDEDAPRKMAYITDVDKPARENWKMFLPEHEKDKLLYVSGIAGHVYAVYSHNAYSLIKVYDLDGNFLRDLPLPTIGTGSVSGRWSQPEVWVNFSSFSYPSTTFKYHFDRDELEVYREFPVDVDVDDVVAEQVWYPSKDGTQVSMFVVHGKDIELDGDNPTLLYGYGGFNVSQRPRFSTFALVWLEAGGVYCVANLRGGGEYGREWHEAGMLENKQNVFDDFIGAAEWLVAGGYTRPGRLGIRGGSNGGLLVGAVTVQRPDLFAAVDCAVPLLDMVTYHRFGLANIWAEEYGNSDDPEQFTYLNAYSPYQNVEDGVKYPAFLVTGSENDARVDPLHARKMAARLQAANEGGGPILCLIRDASGHGGGTTITTQIDQYAQEAAFLMHYLQMPAPH